MKKILVTGSTGFIGNELATVLFKKFPNYEIIIFGRKVKKWNSDYVKQKLKFFDFNKSKFNKYNNFDYIIHCAALLDNKGKYDWNQYYKNNVLLLEKIIHYINFKRLVFISTGSIFSSNTLNPNPNNYYGLSKFLSEKLLEIFSVNKKKQIVIIRFPIIIGKNSSSSLVDYFSSYIIKNKTIEIYGSGKYKRNIMHVDEAVQIIIKLCFKKNYKSNYEIFNAGSSNSMSIIDIANLTKKTLNSKSKISKVRKVRRANYDSIININKLKNAIDYKPLTTKKSIIKFLKDKYL